LGDWSSDVCSSDLLNPDSVQVVGLRKLYGGAQAAIALIPHPAAQILIKNGRIKVGMVSCRIRPSENQKRCFRCLTLGHVARECKGVDRSQVCRRCGEEGHFAIKCKADTEAAKAFRPILKDSGSNDHTLRSYPGPANPAGESETGSDSGATPNPPLQ